LAESYDTFVHYIIFSM